MALLTRPSFVPGTSLVYITVGALMDIWTAVWYFTFKEPGVPLSKTTIFWLSGFFLMGLILMIIGFLMGPIGRYARKAELPPVEAAPAEAVIQQTAAATPHPVVPTAVPASATATNQPAGSVVKEQAVVRPA
jgi:hypothetical protein